MHGLSSTEREHCYLSSHVAANPNVCRSHCSSQLACCQGLLHHVCQWAQNDSGCIAGMFFHKTSSGDQVQLLARVGCTRALML